MRKAPTDPTIGQLNTEPNWFWLVCTNWRCLHRAASALTPWVIRWGPNTPSKWLRSKFRCSVCGTKGADTFHPSWHDMQVRWQPFPVDRMANFYRFQDGKSLPCRAWPASILRQSIT
jgi:hypothetical protein